MVSRFSRDRESAVSPLPHPPCNAASATQRATSWAAAAWWWSPARCTTQLKQASCSTGLGQAGLLVGCAGWWRSLGRCMTQPKQASCSEWQADLAEYTTVLLVPMRLLQPCNGIANNAAKHSAWPLLPCRRGVQRGGQDGADDGAAVGAHWLSGLSCRGAPSALVALCCWVDRKGTVGAPVGAHWLCRLSHRGAPAAAADNTALNIPNPTWSSSTQGAGAARPVLADIIYDGAKRARVRVEGKANGAPFWVERTANKK